MTTSGYPQREKGVGSVLLDTNFCQQFCVQSVCKHSSCLMEISFQLVGKFNNSLPFISAQQDDMVDTQSNCFVDRMFEDDGQGSLK